MYWPKFLILTARKEGRKKEKFIPLAYTQGEIWLKEGRKEGMEWNGMEWKGGRNGMEWNDGMSGLSL